MYAIECTVSGGITGHREGLAKNLRGEVVTFEHRATAEAEANRYREQMRNANARITYRVVPMSPSAAWGGAR